MRAHNSIIWAREGPSGVRLGELSRAASHGVTMDVVVQRDGRLFVDGNWIPEGSLVEFLNEDARAKDLPVMISGDEGCAFAPVAEVLRQFRISGRYRFFLRVTGSVRLIPSET